VVDPGARTCRGLSLDLDRASAVPLYRQVAEHLEARIADGQLAAGAHLDNEIALAASLGLSRPTMRRAIQQLVDKGLLVRRRGIGTQVVQSRISRPVELTSLYDDLTRTRVAPTTRVLLHEVVAAGPEVADALGTAVGAPVVHVRRLRSAGGEPLALMDNHLPVDLAPTAAELATGGLYQRLRERGVSLRVARQRIGARAGGPDECRLLDERRNAPLLSMERSTDDDTGRVVEWGRHVYRPSRHSFEVTVVEP